MSRRVEYNINTYDHIIYLTTDPTREEKTGNIMVIEFRLLSLRSLDNIMETGV